MPLDALLPTIDDRRYDDIVAEARTRIARYTPEWTPVWTDVNDNDPGITLVQLFAWMTEMLLYRMGRVPEMNYIKFLQLLGIELTPAQPARVEVTFPVEETAAAATVAVPPGTQLSAEGAAGEPPILFETERALIAFKARLDRVQVFDGFAYQDVTALNDEFGAGFSPFSRTAQAGSALLLGFTTADPFPATTELDLAFWTDPVGGQALSTAAAVQLCGLPRTPVFAPAQLAWEYWDGRTWATLTLIKDGTNALTQTGHVLLKTPAAGLVQPLAVGALADSRFWLRARVRTATYERAPRLLGVRTNTTAATQAETIRDEVLGGSDGSPNQLFVLGSRPVLAGSLRLEVDEGDGFRTWTEVDDFFASGPRDRHFALNRSSGEVRFGNGFKGDIPAGNVANAGGNVVARTYRAGGGAEGNVAARRLTTLVTPVDGIDGGAVTNLQAAAGGSSEETLDEAKQRAPQTLKNKCRAVTPEDFESLAQQTGVVARARALPLYHPDFPGVEVPGVVTLLVVPEGDAPNPIPSEGTLRTVCAYLNQRRLLTTELYVIGPTYRLVEVEVDLIAGDASDLGQVQQAVEEALLDFFHPLTGGEEGRGWPFGGNIFYSRVYNRVFTVPGVERIERLLIRLDGEEAPECRDVAIPPGELLYSTGHTVNVFSSVEE